MQEKIALHTRPLKVKKEYNFTLLSIASFKQHETL